jgi:peptidylprolyl isomerase
MIQAKSGDTVLLKYKGRLRDNSVFYDSEGHGPHLLTIGQGRIIPAFEEAIVGMEPGEWKTIKVAAVEAYGSYLKELVKTLSRSVLAEGLEPKVGQRLKGTRADGREFSVIVKDISEKSIILDANHPLAGKDLTFIIRLLEIV